MRVGGSTRINGVLIQIGSKDDILAELRRSYQAQIQQVIREIDDLLPKCRTWIDEAVYLKNRADYVTLVARSCDPLLGNEELETLFKRLNTLRQTFMAVLN